MKHQTISFFKSGLRLAGCVPLIAVGDFRVVRHALIIAGVLFFIAEIVGIIEEIGHE